MKKSKTVKKVLSLARKQEKKREYLKEHGKLAFPLSKTTSLNPLTTRASVVRAVLRYEDHFGATREYATDSTGWVPAFDPTTPSTGWSQILRGNPLDVWVPAGGHQPRGWDQLQQLYKYYRVAGMTVKFVLRVIPQSTQYSQDEMAAMKRPVVFMLLGNDQQYTAGDDPYTALGNMSDSVGYPQGIIEIRDKRVKHKFGHCGEDISLSMKWKSDRDDPINTDQDNQWVQTTTAPASSNIPTFAIAARVGCLSLSNKVVYATYIRVSAYLHLEFSNQAVINQSS